MGIDGIGDNAGGKKEREPYVDQERVAMYKLACEKLSFKPANIYHPSSAEDTSPSAAFPEARVIYVDPDTSAMEALKKAGFDAHAADANTFDPGVVDLVILQNAYAKTEEAVSHLRSGGLAMVNNYLGTATELRRNPAFELLGIVNQLEGLVFDTENLDDYWKDVDDEESFKKRPEYELCSKIIARMKSDMTPEGVARIESAKDLFSQYKTLLEMVRSGDVSGTWSEDKSAFMRQGDSYLLFKFSNKKGLPDNLFVFRKK